MHPWFVRYPELFRQEQQALADAFPEMTRCSKAWESRALAYHGRLAFRCNGQTRSFAALLTYPQFFPYEAARVTPLEDVPNREPHERITTRFFPTRHQMPDGSLCLFEPSLTAGHVSGADSLRRAMQWFRYATTGHFPTAMDSEQADLDGHYDRQGDVLGGSVLYRDDLCSSGKLIGFLHSRDERLPLYVATHIETKSGWVNDGELFSSFFPWVPSEWWEAKPSIAAKHLELTLEATYFTLESEPPPVRSVTQLADLLFADATDPIAQLESHIGLGRLNRSATTLALRFPHRTDDYSWLFLRIPLRERSLERQAVPGLPASGVVLDFAKANEWTTQPLGCLRFHSAQQPAMQLRNRHRVPADTSRLRVNVAGAGGLGSQLAVLLAQSGIGALGIWDKEQLDLNNVVRHRCGLGAIGVPKSVAVAAAVRSHSPHCRVSYNHQSVCPVAKTDALWDSDALVSTIANDQAELALNAQAAAYGHTVYYLRALRSGSAGRLVRVRVGVDACLACLGRYFDDNDPRAIAVPPAEDELITRECGNAVLASSASDFAILAGLGCRQLLEDIVSPGAANQWVWTTAGIEESPRLARPFSMAQATLPPHPSCTDCNRQAIRELTISHEVLARLTTWATSARPNETGGILIGERDGPRVLITDASDAGPRAEGSPATFVRDGEHAMRFLRAAVASGLGEYVGEWHSHPNGDPNPSGTDLTSLTEISWDADYLTRCPVMLIVAPDTQGMSLCGTAHPLSGAIEPLAVTIE